MAVLDPVPSVRLRVSDDEVDEVLSMFTEEHLKCAIKRLPSGKAPGISQRGDLQDE